MISVLMPYYERHDALERTLATYQQYDDLELEFVIVDDGSPTPLPFATLRLPASPPLNPCTVYNQAAALATCDLLLLTNPEDMHHNDVLHSLLEKHSHDLDYVAAPCWDDKRGWLAGPEWKPVAPAPDGANLHFCALLSRRLFERAGGFDEDYRNGQGFEDNDFLWRLERAGARFKTGDQFVTHNHSPLRWKLPSNEALFYKKWPNLQK